MMPVKRRTLLHSDGKRKTYQDVALARGRLKGALKNKNVSTDDNTDSDDSREPQADPTIGHEPYIMKLFERSIDLAQFSENSPLYPLCRAWLKNQPKADDTTEPAGKTSRMAIKREYNPDIFEQFMNGDLSEIAEMPRPEPADNMEPFFLEKPETVGDFVLDQSALDKEELLNEHIVEWKRIRERWISHRRQYEEKRYNTSFKLLDALFRES